MKQGIWLSDLSQCRPTGAISRDGVHGTWIAVDYDVDEGHGMMLFGLPESDAPALTMQLSLTGWHEIQLGIFYGAGAGLIENRVLCAKLSGDAAFSRFSHEQVRSGKDGDYPEKDFRWSDATEVFWKCADLTEQDLIIARPPRGEMAECQTNLAYVRLVQMNETAIGEWNSEQPSPETKVLIANYDGGSFGQWGSQLARTFSRSSNVCGKATLTLLFTLWRADLSLYIPQK